MPPQFSESFQRITIPAGAHGTLRGSNILAADGHIKARRFLQVPYARAPVGELRWRKPAPLPDDADWSGIDGEQFGNVTAQPRYEITNDKGESINFDVPFPMSEDALTCNIWTPAGEPPADGWPVFVFLHGGWLQIGNPGMTDKTNPTDMLDQALKCVVIQPAYRLSLFGFLASKEIQEENEDGIAGNFGFWDQRLAIEWSAKNAHIFGGNGDNITIGGLSAGAYSVQVQVGHELLSGGQPIIRRAIQYSNAIPSQPKSVSESQAAFDGLLKACGIPLDLDSKEKMLRLRALPMETLRDLIMSLDIHTFRAVTDGAFISPNLHGSLADGSFAAAFARRNMSLVVGEVSHEELLYGATNPPKGPDALATELANYYPAEQVGKLLAAFDVRTPPSDPVALRAVFGDMVATGQVYAPVRALVRALLTAVPANKVLRYRVAWQPGELDAASIWDGVTHADDLPLWWCLIRLFGREDDAPVRAWLEPLQAFMDGKDASAEWYDGQKPEGTWLREIRDGKIAVVKDDKWTRCLEVADAIAV